MTGCNGAANLSYMHCMNLRLFKQAKHYSKNQKEYFYNYGENKCILIENKKKYW